MALSFASAILLAAPKSSGFSSERPYGPTAPGIAATAVADTHVAHGGPVDFLPPLIAYGPLSNSTDTTSRTLAITVTDASGVPTSGDGLPVVYFRKNAGAYTGSQCSHVAGNDYVCTLSFAEIGGVAAGDTIDYYVAAQDGAVPPVVTTNPNLGAGGFTPNPPAAGTPPATPQSFLVSTSFPGTVDVCAAGCDYTTLTGGGGVFQALNDGVLTGDVRVEIAGDLVAGEDGSVALGPLLEEPPGSGYTVTIHPVGAPRQITSTAAREGGFIRLNGADRITLDGSLDGAGSDRSLTVTDTAPGPDTAVIWLQSNGGDGATDNTVRNVNVVGHGNTTTLIGIGAGGSIAGVNSLGVGNDGNTYHNNSVSRTQIGLYSQGASAANKNAGTVITRNSIDAAAPNNVQRIGIHVGFEDGPLISENRIGWLQGTNTDSIGIALGLPAIGVSAFFGNETTGATVTRNLIGPVINTTTFSAAGITLASASSGTAEISNNVIHSVGTNGTSGDYGVGIVVGGGTGSTTRVLHNSVSLSGTFSSSSTTPSPHYALAIGPNDPVVEVRNNASSATLVYTGASGNVGRVYAIGTASSAFTNLASDSNDLFVGTAPAHFVGRTGTLAQGVGASHATLTAWQTATGGDAASISVDPAFNSETSLTPLPGSPLIGAGTPAGVAIDFAGAPRDRSTPSIGAYESGADVVGPSIVYTPFANTLSTSNRTLSTTITDVSGVPTSGVGLPVIHFRKGTSGSFASTQCTHVGGSSYDCVIDHGLVSGGSVTAGDEIQYYVLAQEGNGAVSANPSIGAGGFAPNPPSAATPPVPNRYFVSTPVSGSYAVGTGQPFTSLTNSGGIFQFIEASVVTGDVTIEITSDLDDETGTIPLKPWVEDVPGAGYSLTIRPAGAPRTITGAGTGAAVIKLDGADGVTIDGSLSGGTDRSLTIRNPSTTTGTTAVWIASLGAAAGARNVTIENCVIETGTTGRSSVTTFGVFAGHTSGAVSGADNDGLTLRNNHIRRATIGIQAIGLAGAPNDLTVIEGNLIGDAEDEDSIGRTGIHAGHTIGAGITRNTVRNVRTSDPAVTSSNNARGILLGTGFVSSSVTRNVITGVRYTGSAGYGGKGIDIATGNAASDLTIANNVVSEIGGDGWSDLNTDATVGLRILSPTGGVRLYHNSVNLGTGRFAGSSAPNQSTAFYAQGGVSGLDVRNNIFATNLDNTTPSSGTHRTFAIATGATTPALFTTIDANAYFPSGPDAIVGRLGGIDRSDLGAWQEATGQDGNSLQADPQFLSPTDLHLDTMSGPSPVENRGLALAAVPLDIDADARDPFAPEIGADEIAAPCFGVVCTAFDTDCGIAACDAGGVSGNCDLLMPRERGTACRLAAGSCDLTETCDGTNTRCPSDSFVEAGTECREVAGDCDVAEACTGLSADCPADLFVPATTECRPSSGPACDPAEMCPGDAPTCPADMVEPSDAVAELTLHKIGSDAEISWGETEPGSFNVYRGSRGPGEGFVYDHGCLFANEPGPSVIDSTLPPPHVALYYLVSRAQPPCEESSIGLDSAAKPIPNDAPCPDPGADLDGDGVLDWLDDCPAIPNGDQLDTDGDSHGDACDVCPAHANPGQEDADDDQIGDACD